MTQNPRDHRGVLDDRQVPHLATKIGGNEWAYLVDFLDQRGEGSVDEFDVLGIWSVWIPAKPPSCISFNRGTAWP